MATILEVLNYHPNYKGWEWWWNDNAIDPQSQEELDQEITSGQPPVTVPLFVWVDDERAPRPTYAQMDVLRDATDQVIIDNQSGETTKDRDVFLGRVASAEGQIEGHARQMEFEAQMRDALLQVEEELQKQNPDFALNFDPQIVQEWASQLGQVRRFRYPPP